DGTVHIKGSVGGNASITASGDVIIDHFVEGAYIKAGRNIIIKGGVNASGKGRLEAKKKIMGNFFESATLVAKGQIEGNYFLNCNIVTDNLLIAKGKKGRIMGGSIIAAVGVEAVTIGNLGSEQTVFYVGDLVRIQKEINDCKQKKKEDEERLRTLLEDFDKVLKVSVKGNDNGEILRKIEIAIQIEKKKIQTFKDEIERLRIVKKRAKKAYVRVWGHLYSNVIFTINDYKKIIKNDVCGVFLTGEKSDRR
ncbi:MAG: FapA family protein, partial [Clostridiales bacterium]|nr:FapA family protein [Clostridiales bacterium]